MPARSQPKSPGAHLETEERPPRSVNIGGYRNTLGRHSLALSNAYPIVGFGLVIVENHKTEGFTDAARESDATECSVINHARGEGAERVTSLLVLTFRTRSVLDATHVAALRLSSDGTGPSDLGAASTQQLA